MEDLEFIKNKYTKFACLILVFIIVWGVLMAFCFSLDYKGESPYKLFNSDEFVLIVIWFVIIGIGCNYINFRNVIHINRYLADVKPIFSTTCDFIRREGIHAVRQVNFEGDSYLILTKSKYKDEELLNTRIYKSKYTNLEVILYDTTDGKIYEAKIYYHVKCD